MRGISQPVLFELRAQRMAECRGLAPLARGHALVSTEARSACPVGIPDLVGVGRLALPRLFDLESNRSAVPGEPHAGRRPETCTRKALTILCRRGLLFPLK